MSSPGVAVIVPARYASTRFPGKPLAVIAGRPLIEWVYRRASEIDGVSRVIVATDHDHVVAAVEGFGGDVVLTAGGHPTGTDRVAEVARNLHHEYIVNLQGDEPVFPPKLVEDMIAVISGSRHDPDRSPLMTWDGTDPTPDESATKSQAPLCDVVTACHPTRDRQEIINRNVVKVVTDGSGRALYFSRSPIPFIRDAETESEMSTYYRHIGIYVFRRDSLLRFAETPPTPLEQSEGLEQLRALEIGMSIGVVRTTYSTVGVDVPEDTKRVEKALTNTYSL